ncbi:hypothetical protein FXV77_05495 [Sphingobacterium phlebotomi]|uniref:Uncharacterized protein n=1 Tax=Sphingobacterium phlebotomi TaxID=2605433 RepID=A0A5D4HCB4_9SPHI|nr:hypothetical protein [Sphingobacterium phlebotomi]TYR37459.1 hypothetical protein FXV77_05495 [Sphingobacterium phlebotomi]
MDEKQLKQLMAGLDSRGFLGGTAEQDIAVYAALGLPLFSVNVQRDFGEERMFFKLTFELKEDQKNYELTNIHAKYRRPIVIDRQMAKEVDIPKLEDKMASVEWETYWRKVKLGLDTTDIGAKISSIYSGLASILNGEVQDREIALLIMYKYWPEDMFNLLAGNLEFGKEAYERSMDYRLGTYPTLTAEQAFLMMSERIDSLENMLMELEIPDKLAENLPYILYGKLRAAPDNAELKMDFNAEDFHILLTIPLKKTDGWYHLHDYTIEATAFPPIAHGIFNGVDSDKLDKKLASIDWRNDPDLVSRSEEKGELEFDTEVEQLEEELFRLALDPEGKIVADQLRVRHFLGAPFFDSTISDEAWDWLASLPKKTTQFPVHILVPQAIQMMSGRPVLAASQEWNSPDDIWLKVNYKVTGTGNIVSIAGISEKDLDAMVHTLPVNHYEKGKIATGLKNGKRVYAVSTYGTLVGVELSTDADRLYLYNKQGKSIPFNFRLDPDWKPVDIEEKRFIAQRKVTGTNKRKGKNL